MSNYDIDFKSIRIPRRFLALLIYLEVPPKNACQNRECNLFNYSFNAFNY